MGYSKQHVLSVRKKILTAANHCFRTRGFHATSVNQIMENAGLTHGGFYAHFRSKEDLFCQAMGEDLNFTEILRSLSKQKNKSTALIQAVTYYLNIENRDKVGNACTMVTLCPDVARMGDKAKSYYSASFDNLIEELSQYTGSKDTAIAAISQCVGALSLARAMQSDKAAKAILQSSLSVVSALLEQA